MKDKIHQQERQKALDEIRAGLMEKMKEVSLWGTAFVKGRSLDIENYARLEETFHWPNSIIFAVDDLKADKSLKAVFSRVSKRYKGDDRVLGLADDLTYSAAAQRDGRESAFEDVLKVLDIAARDFDISYQLPMPGSFEFWRQKEPNAPERIRSIHAESKRKYGLEALAALKELVEALRKEAAPVSPPKAWPSL